MLKQNNFIIRVEKLEKKYIIILKFGFNNAVDNE
jgi:hypothetical protein